TRSSCAGLGGGLPERLAGRLRGRLRVLAGRGELPTAGCLDSRTVKAAETVRAATCGYDAGKKIKGQKRHVVVDTLGLLLCVIVTAASVQDRDGAHPLPALLRARLSTIGLVWADGGYAGRLQAWAKQVLGLAATIVKRSDDVRGFVVLPRRWVVERTFAWLTRYRRLVRIYERKPEHHEALIRWATVHQMTRRPAREVADLAAGGGGDIASGVGEGEQPGAGQLIGLADVAGVGTHRSRGGRPVSHDPGLYKQRNTAERCINRIEEWRGPAFRFDKTPTATSPAFTYAEPSCGSEAFNPSEGPKSVQALAVWAGIAFIDPSPSVRGARSAAAPSQTTAQPRKSRSPPGEMNIDGARRMTSPNLSSSTCSLKVRLVPCRAWVHSRSAPSPMPCRTRLPGGTMRPPLPVRGAETTPPASMSASIPLSYPRTRPPQEAILADRFGDGEEECDAH
ncbi:transposase, partial [Streptosporangium roseum]|uniref:transposase n=1 Tax=Streptosporangium roseum TaxID=2001 RepID=UPI00331E5AB5